MRVSLAKFEEEKRQEVRRLIPASLAMKIAESAEELNYL